MIKKATIEDVPILNVLNKEVQKLHHKLYPNKFKPPAMADMSNVFKKFLEGSNSTILIAYSNEKTPMGYIIYEDKLHEESGFAIEYRSLYIHHISVDKEFQGAGLGKKLIQKVFDSARKLNIDCIELDVWAQNNNAKEFFKYIGFKAFNEKMSLDL
jgi:diamine N-acetyltransferase